MSTFSDALWTLAASVVTAGAPFVAYFVVNALQKFAKNRGIEINQKLLQRVDQFLINGMNLAASSTVQLRNIPAKDRKQWISEQALNYLQVHGKATLDQLKADVNDPKFQEAMLARIETLITDPTQPTPASISPDKVETVVAPTKAG